MIQESVKALLQTEAEAVQNIPVTPEFEKALNILWEQVHQKKGKLITSGMGKAGQIAINMATTFSSTGTPAVFLHPSEAQHGDLGVIQENDTMILISNSGNNREIIELSLRATPTPCWPRPQKPLYLPAIPRRSVRWV
jgi:arabinose-5-phosphate isomerase